MKDTIPPRERRKREEFYMKKVVTNLLFVLRKKFLSRDSDHCTSWARSLALLFTMRFTVEAVETFWPEIF